MRFSRMVFGCLMAAALCGCAGLTAAEKQGLTQFGTSTSSYADKVSTVATAAQTDIIQMRLDALGFPTPDSETLFERVMKDDASFARYLESKGLKKPDEKQSLSSAKPEQTDGKQSPSLSDHIAMMNGLASGLKDYGQALVDLANYGDPSARLNSIQGIATNLFTIMQSSAAEQDKAKATSTVIGLVTNEIIEAVKKQNIKQTVKAFSQVVKHAAALLRAEFVGKKMGTLVYAYSAAIDTYESRLPKVDPKKSTAATARLVAQTALEQFKSEDYHCIDIVKVKDPTDPTNEYIEGKVKNPKKAVAIAAAYVAFCAAADTRREIAISRAKLLNMKERLKAMQKQGLAATNALEEANDKMVAALSTGSLSVADIQNFAQKTAAFAQAIKAIK